MLNSRRSTANQQLQKQMAEASKNPSSPTVKALYKELKGVKEWGELGISLRDMKYDVIKEIRKDEVT